jgi:hypothetical protein
LPKNEEEIIERNDEEQKRSTEIYDSFRDELYKRQLSNSEAYDRAILSLSSAGLAISLTFIKFIVPLEEATYVCVLKASWVLFLLSIISTVASFLIGNKGISKQLEYAEQYYIDGKAKAFNKFNIYAYFNTIFNYISGILFLVALTSVVSFVILNLNQGNDDMSKNKKTFVTDSASVPTMQKTGSTSSVKKSANIPAMGQAPGTTTTSQGSGSGNSSGSDKSGK